MVKILSFLLIERDVINKEKEVHESKLKSRHLLLCTALSQAPLGHTHNDFLLLRALDCMPRNSGGDYQVFTVGTGTCMQQRCHLFLPQIHWNQNVLGINVVELKQEERRHGEIIFPACALICLHVQWWTNYLCKHGFSLCLSSFSPCGSLYLQNQLFKKIMEAAAYIYKPSLVNFAQHYS